MYPSNPTALFYMGLFYVIACSILFIILFSRDTFPIIRKIVTEKKFEEGLVWVLGNIIAYTIVCGYFYMGVRLLIKYS